MIDPGFYDDVTGNVGCVFNLNFVNSCRNHPGFGMELPNVLERSFFGGFVEDLQQAPETEIAEQWSYNFV